MQWMLLITYEGVIYYWKEKHIKSYILEKMSYSLNMAKISCHGNKMYMDTKEIQI